METRKNTKLDHYQDIIQKTIAMAIILAFALAICVVPATAKVRKPNKRSNAANRSVKSSPQTKKDLTDPNLDTLTVTNQNVGNFKKGFIGDNAVSAVSNSPFYKLDVIAKLRNSRHYKYF